MTRAITNHIIMCIIANNHDIIEGKNKKDMWNIVITMIIEQERKLILDKKDQYMD